MRISVEKLLPPDWPVILSTEMSLLLLFLLFVVIGCCYVQRLRKPSSLWVVPILTGKMDLVIRKIADQTGNKPVSRIPA